MLPWGKCLHHIVIFLLQGPEVRSGDVPQPILLKEGQDFNFTTKRGVSTDDTVSVNYDDFVNDVEVGDILLVDGIWTWIEVALCMRKSCLEFCHFLKNITLCSSWHSWVFFTCQQVLMSLSVSGGMMSLAVKSKTQDLVKCKVIDGGELKSRRHLNVRGKSATLPSITGLFSFYVISLLISY